MINDILKPKTDEELLIILNNELRSKVTRISNYLLSVIDSNYNITISSYLLRSGQWNGIEQYKLKDKKSLSKKDKIIMKVDFCTEIQDQYRINGMINYKELKAKVKEILMIQYLANLKNNENMYDHDENK